MNNTIIKVSNSDTDFTVVDELDILRAEFIYPEKVIVKEKNVRIVCNTAARSLDEVQ